MRAYFIFDTLDPSGNVDSFGPYWLSDEVIEPRAQKLLAEMPKVEAVIAHRFSRATFHWLEVVSIQKSGTGERGAAPNA